MWKKSNWINQRKFTKTFRHDISRSLFRALAVAEQQRPRQTQSIVGSLHVSGKLPTYPSPRSTLTLTSHLGHNVALGVGYVGSQRTPRQGSYKKLQSFFKDFSRTTLDFQGPPARNIISQIVEKCTFPVYFNKTLRVELFVSPTCLQFSVHLSLSDSYLLHKT